MSRHVFGYDYLRQQGWPEVFGGGGFQEPRSRDAKRDRRWRDPGLGECRRIAGPTRRTRLGRQGFLERRIPSVHVVGNG